MKSAIIHTLKVSIGANRSTVEVVAQIIEGQLESGLNAKIQLNRSASIAVPIAQIIGLDNGQVKLILDCEEEEGALFLESLNFADEWILVE